MEQAILKIFIYHPDMNVPVYKEFGLPFQQDLSVLKALFQIADHYDDSPAFRRYYCNKGQCAGCVMAINGRIRRACTTRLAETMTLEPAYGYPVIRDLVVDFGRKVSSGDEHYKILEGSLIWKARPKIFRSAKSARIWVKEDICRECQTKECLQACWLGRLEHLEDRFGRRIRQGSLLNVEWICDQCPDRPCVESCPTGAIALRGGQVGGIHPSLCIGCGMCMDRCPHGSIMMNLERGYAVKCDWCQGEPACARACSRGGLHLFTHEG